MGGTSAGAAVFQRPFPRSVTTAATSPRVPRMNPAAHRRRVHRHRDRGSHSDIIHSSRRCRTARRCQCPTPRRQRQRQCQLREADRAAHQPPRRQASPLFRVRHRPAWFRGTDLRRQYRRAR
eukprot:9062663-Pyramimonas_sp.AAC.1